ncbi:glycosyltransferase [Candidatus Kaiserbacteria bacterium]|nr:glycosyltransferase [Candidatus Kaiserbacteria bacterium]
MIQATKQRKKVLYLITKATWGGAQKYVFDLATHLPCNLEPVVAYGAAGKLSQDLQTSHVRIVEIRSLQRDVAFISDIGSFFGILACIRKEKPDVLHLNSSKAAALGALAGRLCGIQRIVFTAHGWPFKESRNPISKVLIYAVSWFTAFLSHAVIVVSEIDKTLAGTMPFIGNKTHYIPIAIETPQFLPREEAAAKLSVTGDAPRIVTIAELTPNKGLRYAIEAVALLKEKGIAVSYSIIGDGELRKELEMLAREKGVADQVRFLGFIRDAAAYLRAFDLYILPSIKEGMPYVLAEARAADLPIVATHTVDVPDAIPHGDARALADAIQKTLSLEGKPVQREQRDLAAMIATTTALYVK